MNLQEFIEDFSDILQTEEKIGVDTVLSDLPEWDSLAIMSLTAYFDSKLNIKLQMSDVNKFHTFADIVNKIGL